MKQARIGLLVAASVLAAPAMAAAQTPASKGAVKAAPAVPAAPAAPAAAAAAPAVATDVDLDADKDAKAPPADAAPAGATVAGDAGGLGDICQIDPSACPTVNLDEAATRKLHEQMYAVQQIYALRYHRIETQLSWAFTLNDQFVAHPGPTLAANYYITNVLAIGVNGGYHFNSDQPFNATTRRAARVAVPLTEYQWDAALNFTYVPMYGKFAGFGDFIFHYDAYVVGGLGAVSTRPIAVVDPDNRTFKYEPKLAFNAGIGVRVFFNRWLAAVLEVRDYIFPDKLESLSIDPNPAKRSDEGTWYGDSKITNNVQAQVGIAVFLPATWEYRLPK